MVSNSLNMELRELLDLLERVKRQFKGDPEYRELTNGLNGPRSLGNMDNDRYNLTYMRHTGQWWEIYTDFSIDKCWQPSETNPTSCREVLTSPKLIN